MKVDVSKILESRGYQRGDMLRDSKKGIVVLLCTTGSNIYCCDLKDEPIIYDRYGVGAESNVLPVDGCWTK